MSKFYVMVQKDLHVVPDDWCVGMTVSFGDTANNYQAFPTNPKFSRIGLVKPYVEDLEYWHPTTQPSTVGPNATKLD